MTHTQLIGVDDSGTGALAGCIAVAACHVPPEHWETLRAWGFKDSKRLTPLKRLELRTRLETEGPAMGIRWAVGTVDPIHIDVLTPKDAMLRAGRTAVILTACRLGLELGETSVLIDGLEVLNNLPSSMAQAAIPKADVTHLPVSVASVLAKLAHDEDVTRSDSSWPAFNFAVNKGYPTLEHLTMLLKVGPVYGVHRKHYLRKCLLAHYEKYMHYVMEKPRWLIHDQWLRNVEDDGVTIESTWPVINPEDPIYWKD